MSNSYTVYKDEQHDISSMVQPKLLDYPLVVGCSKKKKKKISVILGFSYGTVKCPGVMISD